MTKYSSEHRLLERDEESTALEAMLERAAMEAGGCLIFEGPAGIGKTRLLEETHRAAQDRGFRVLTARAGEREGEHPWAVVRLLFEPIVNSPGPAVEALLAGPAAPCRGLFDPTAPTSPAGPDSSFAIFNGLVALIRGIAEPDHPVVIAIDDLHWVDGPSLGFIEFLIRRIDSLPVLVATTLRPAEPGSDAAMIDSITSDRHGRRVEPRPLSRDGSAAALRARLGEEIDPELLDEGHEVTGGNPLLLSELARAMEVSRRDPDAGGELNPGDIAALGSRAVSRTVEVRLQRAGEAGRSLAAAAAVLGEEAHLADAIALADLDPEAANRASVDLARLEVLSPGSRVHFVHPVVRSAIYEQIGVPERARMHRAAADLLSNSGAAPEKVAPHLMQVPPAGDPAAVATLRDAAVSAAAGGDARAATALLRRALAEPPEEAILTDCTAQLGAAEVLVDGPASVIHLKQVLGRIDAPPYRVAVAELLARSLIFQERVPDAIRVCLETLEDLGGQVDPDLVRRMEAVLIETTMVETREAFGDYAQRVQSLLDEADLDPGEDYGSKALLGLSAISATRDLSLHSDEVIERCRRAAEGDILLREGMNGIAQLAPAQGLTMAGRSSEAIALLERASSWDERFGSMMGHLANRIFLARAHLFAGNLPDALSDSAEALPLSRAYGIVPGVAWASALHAETLIEMGEIDRAVVALSEQVDHDQPSPDGWHWLNFMVTRARVKLAQGDAEGALDEVQLAGKRYADHGGVAPTWVCWRPTAAAALQSLGRGDEATELLEQELELAERWGAGRLIGSTLRAQAELSPDDAHRIEILERAVGVLEPTEARLDLAKALVDLGSAIRRSNRKVDSRDPLGRGMNLAAECGACGLADRARSELRASGVRPRRTSLQGPGSLTESERRVALLARDGRTNKEIAGELFVTVKTVEVHLSNVYRKLGIKGRRQLPVALPGDPTDDQSSAANPPQIHSDEPPLEPIS